MTNYYKSRVKGRVEYKVLLLKYVLIVTGISVFIILVNSCS